MPLLYALPLVFNTEAILHSNNTRDMKQDESNGITTLAILLGQRGSCILFMFLLFTPYVVLAVDFNAAFLLPLVTLRVAFDLDKPFRKRNFELVCRLSVYYEFIKMGSYYEILFSFSTQPV